MSQPTIHENKSIGSHGSSRYALIVDDDPGILCVYELALADLGFTPILVSDSREAVEQARVHRPELIILDQRMPGLTGVELAQQLKAFGPIPLIMVSAGRNVQEAALSAGATAWLEKPFDVDDLIRIILEHTAAADMLTA